MTLLNLDNLKSIEPDTKAHYVRCAMQLSRIYQQWKRQHDGKMLVNVEFFGERDRKQGVHASELSGCQRQLVYSIIGTKRIVLAGDKDVGMQRRFDVGTMLHALTQKEFHLMCEWYNAQNTGTLITFEEEVSVHPGLGGVAEMYSMHSSCDGRFTFWAPGYDHTGSYVWVPFLSVGLEIKTASDKEYEKTKEPKKEHKEQTCMYMAALSMPLMWVMYINKSNQYYTPSEPPFLFQFDRILWERTLEPRIVDAISMAVSKKLPMRQEGMQCGWCAFAHECKPQKLKTGVSSHAPPPGAI
jgi:CRISPR/Cas system-associated exonuclease Cas4 (RecB family)